MDQYDQLEISGSLFLGKTIVEYLDPQSCNANLDSEVADNS